MAKRKGSRQKEVAASGTPAAAVGETASGNNGVRKTARPPTAASVSENALRPSTARRARKAPESDRERSTDAPSQRLRPKGPAPALDAVPAEVRSKFVQVGRDYYFADGARAFTDRGKRLTTPSENTEVVKSLVGIAQARGWSQVTVSGTERFRKEAWSAARSAGLEVRGYRPTPFEHERLVRAVAKQSSREPVTEDESRDLSRERKKAKDRKLRVAPNAREVIFGRLVDHGAAPYQNDPQARRSYFVKLETPEGDRTVWGVDLERALRESLSQPKPGDEVGLRQVRRERLTVKALNRNAEGVPRGAVYDKHVYRNQWVVEKREFLEQRAAAARTFADTQVSASTAARRHPELLGSYLQLRSAEEVAALRIRDREDQRRFIDLVRSTLAESIASGAPLPPVRLREHAASRQEPPVRHRPERVAAPVRE